jgi:endoglucanase
MKLIPTKVCTVAATAAIVAFTMSAQAWVGMSTPMLHVNGRFFQDPNNRNVLLRGYMQAGASWFNGEGHNYSDPSDYTSASSCAGMLNFYNGAADILAGTAPRYNTDHGWYCSYTRLCGNGTANGFAPGWDSNGNLSDQNQFNGYINNILIPYADHCAQDGLYLIICGTPSEVYPGNDTGKNMTYQYQQNLITFWKALANSGLRWRPNVLFEICNEPITIETSFGAGNWGSGSSAYWSALQSFMQPIVNAIRNTGDGNIILVPSLGYQGENQGWASYPVSGYGVAYSGHLYPAYGNVHDNATAMQNLWNSNYKPCADHYPLVITEMYWYQNPIDGQYDDLFAGSTSGFGNAAKSAIDNQGNVWYLIGMVGDLLGNLNNGLGSTTLGSGDGAQASFAWMCQYTWAGVPGPVASGTYKIISLNSGKAMDAYGARTTNGTQIIQWGYGGGNNQKWTVTDTGGGIYKIIGVQSGRGIDVSGWGTANGTKVQLWDYLGGSNQRFTFSPQSGGTNYWIRPTHATGSALDVNGVSKADGALVQLWQWVGGNNQQWSFQAP